MNHRWVRALITLAPWSWAMGSAAITERHTHQDSMRTARGRHEDCTNSSVIPFVRFMVARLAVRLPRKTPGFRDVRRWQFIRSSAPRRFAPMPPSPGWRVASRPRQNIELSPPSKRGRRTRTVQRTSRDQRFASARLSFSPTRGIRNPGSGTRASFGKRMPSGVRWKRAPPVAPVSTASV